MRGPAALALFALLAAPAPAAGYGFEAEAETTMQAYELRWVRFSGPDELLYRRRLVHDLRLRVFGLLDPFSAVDDLRAPEPAAADLAFAVSLRLEHDFGEFVQDEIGYRSGGGVPARGAATAIVPELLESDFALELRHAALSGRGLLGLLDFDLGRQLAPDPLDLYVLDGLRLRARSRLGVLVEASGGLVVRGTSPLGGTRHDPDGISAARCLVYDDYIGSWREPEDPRCADAEGMTPTLGFAIETAGLRRVRARLAYRRALRDTPAGVYPTAAGWGTVEERVGASADFDLEDGVLRPYAALRYSLLLGGLDLAHAGVRVRAGRWTITPEIGYTSPSFDGDSLFNVWVGEPAREARVTTELGRGRLSTYARGEIRVLSAGDAARMSGVADSLVVGGAAGARWGGRDRGVLRLDLRAEDGAGGLFLGGDASGRLRARANLELEGRLGAVHYRDDDPGTSVGAQAGARLMLDAGIAAFVLGEANLRTDGAGDLRVLGVIDLAFHPEI